MLFLPSFQLWVVLREAEHSTETQDTDIAASKASSEIKHGEATHRLFLVSGNKTSSLTSGDAVRPCCLVKSLVAADSRDLGNPGGKMWHFAAKNCTTTLVNAAVHSPASVSPICNSSRIVFISAMGLAKIVSNMKVNRKLLVLEKKRCLLSGSMLRLLALFWLARDTTVAIFNTCVQI